jgi:hypothetical protein
MYFSTDYVSACCVKKDSTVLNLCKISPKEDTIYKINDLLSQPRNVTLKIGIDKIKDVLMKTPLSRVYTYSDCNSCEGSGSVEWEFRGYFMNHDCPFCSGKGNHKVFSNDEFEMVEGYSVKIHNQTICVKALANLCKVADILEEKHVYLVGQSSIGTGSMFCLGEGDAVTVIIAPKICSDESSILGNFSINLKNPFGV